MRNRNRFNAPFDQEIIDQVWEKASIIEGYDAATFRKDKCGAWIFKSMYNDSNLYLSFGWEIDHIIPKNIGGTDELSNLQPLQWENNKEKGDYFPDWHCIVSSEKGSSVYKTIAQSENTIIYFNQIRSQINNSVIF